MNQDTFHNSADQNEQKSFEERFEAFKKMFTVKLDDLGLNTINVAKSRATQAETTEKFALGQKLENKEQTINALDTLAHETNHTPKITHNFNFETIRLPDNQNALAGAQKLLEENGLGFVLDMVQKQTEARLGHSCVYSFDGMQDFV